MNCLHQRKIAWETDCHRVACLDCGEILLCDKAEPIPVNVELSPFHNQLEVQPTAESQADERPLSKNCLLVMELRGLNWTYDEIAIQMKKTVSVVKMFETIAKKAIRRNNAIRGI